jgi:hypothetical protein
MLFQVIFSVIIVLLHGRISPELISENEEAPSIGKVTIATGSSPHGEWWVFYSIWTFGFIS